MTKQKTHLRDTIATEKRVAVAIWRLSTGNSYRTVSKVFGIGISTACTICKEFRTALARISHDFIPFPKNGFESVTEIQQFKEFCGCVTVIIRFGAHLLISARPYLVGVCAYSRKGMNRKSES